MKTKTIKIYSFNELDAKGKERVLDKWREHDTGDAWSDEWRESMELFAKWLGITVKDWSVSVWGNSYVKWEYENSDWNYADGDPAETMTGVRLRTWIINNWLPEFWKGKYYSKTLSTSPYRYISRYSKINGSYMDCPMTGYCGDNSLIYPLLQFVENPNNSTCLNDLIEECFSEWYQDWIKDMEWQNSDEYIIDTIECNDYEFHDDGTIA